MSTIAATTVITESLPVISWKLKLGVTLMILVFVFVFITTKYKKTDGKVAEKAEDKPKKQFNFGEAVKRKKI